MRKKCVHATIGQRESNSERRDQAFFLFVLCFAATLLARQVHSYIQEHTQEAVLNDRLRNTRLGTESKVDISSRFLTVTLDTYAYGVATVSRIDKIIGLFCRIASLL